MLGRCEMPCPVVLRSSDGLEACELGYGGDLAEDTWDHDKESPDQGSRASVVERQTDVSVDCVQPETILRKDVSHVTMASQEDI